MKNSRNITSKNELQEAISCSEEALLTVPNTIIKEAVEDALEKNGSELAWYKHRVAQLEKLLAGCKKERFITAHTNQQLPLFPDQELMPIAVEETKIIPGREVVVKKRENHPGRMLLPAHLRRVETIIEPDNLTENMVKIGEEVTEILEYTPEDIFVKRIVRPKYVVKNTSEDISTEEKTSIVIAELPDRPINRCIASASVLAMILVNKFVDHLPIYRQIQIFKRVDVTFSKSTINGWQIGVYNLLLLLYEQFLQSVITQGYLQVDETPIKVLDKEKKKNTHQGYMWVYHAPLTKSVLFDYRPGRGADGPGEMLKTFNKGYLQTDGYAAYKQFGNRAEVTHITCMAHIRRKFHEALEFDKKRAEYGLTEIQKLYAIEAEIKDEKPEIRHAVRLKKSHPILTDLGVWILNENYKVTPKSSIGVALAYALAQWPKMMNYLKDGCLEIDNNGVENAIRPMALGRKNWMFAGSHDGAKRAAMWYTFFGSCKKHNINPYKWMVLVLDNINECKTNEMYKFFPHNVAKYYPNLLQK
jgi:transposase